MRLLAIALIISLFWEPGLLGIPPKIQLKETG